MTEDVLHGYVSKEGIQNIPCGRKVVLPGVTADQCAALYAAVAEEKGYFAGHTVTHWLEQAYLLFEQKEALRNAWKRIISDSNAVMFETQNGQFVIIAKRDGIYYRTTFDKHGPLSDTCVTVDEICDIIADYVWVC